MEKKQLKEWGTRSPKICQGHQCCCQTELYKAGQSKVDALFSRSVAVRMEAHKGRKQS